MEDFDFVKFYDQQPDYEEFRNDDKKRAEYKIAVAWKTESLCRLVPVSCKFVDIFEVGCAFGILLNNVADRLLIQTRSGLDISGENIKMAHQLFPSHCFLRGTIDDNEVLSKIQKEGEKFNLILLSDIVEHIPDDQRFLMKISKMTSYVLLNLPLEKCYRNKRRNYGIDDPSGHLHKYNKKDAARLIESAGFKVIACNITNAHFNDEFFNLYRMNRNERVMKKPFLRMYVWLFIYYTYDLIRSFLPRLYVRIFGSNYFALLESISANE
jgi:hypothetical protein